MTATTANAATKVSKGGARLYRVIMPTDNIEEGAAYYAGLLGTDGTRVSVGRHYFHCGGVVLALYDPQADGDNTIPRPNFEHIYFAVADLGGFFKRATALGTLSEEIGDGKLPLGKIENRPWGERSFYLKDPFGNPLCFVDESTVFTAA